MSEKVLGFYEKDAELFATDNLAGIWKVYKLVPVRLKSESVGLKWLEGECKRISPERDLNKFFTNRDVYHVEYGKVEAIRELLCAVRAKAEDGKK